METAVTSRLKKLFINIDGKKRNHSDIMQNVLRLEAV